MTTAQKPNGLPHAKIGDALQSIAVSLKKADKALRDINHKVRLKFINTESTNGSSRYTAIPN